MDLSAIWAMTLHNGTDVHAFFSDPFAHIVRTTYQVHVKYIEGVQSHELFWELRTSAATPPLLISVASRTNIAGHIIFTSVYTSTELAWRRKKSGFNSDNIIYLRPVFVI